MSPSFGLEISSLLQFLKFLYFDLKAWWCGSFGSLIIIYLLVVHNKGFLWLVFVNNQHLETKYPSIIHQPEMSVCKMCLYADCTVSERWWNVFFSFNNEISLLSAGFKLDLQRGCALFSVAWVEFVRFYKKHFTSTCLSQSRAFKRALI